MAIIAVGDTLSVGANSTSNVQPASGEVWDITCWGMDQQFSSTTSADNGYIELYNGTQAARTTVIAGGGAISTPSTPAATKIVVTNSQYARLVNNTSGSKYMGYRGVKL